MAEPRLEWGSEAMEHAGLECFRHVFGSSYGQFCCVGRKDFLSRFPEQRQPAVEMFGTNGKAGVRRIGRAPIAVCIQQDTRPEIHDDPVMCIPVVYRRLEYRAQAVIGHGAFIEAVDHFRDVLFRELSVFGGHHHYLLIMMECAVILECCELRNGTSLSSLSRQ
ncbi:protein of unknown function [Methylocaldum szegediense]|uniref:Uncharacterized protein n=1 Tax=Methylocaldum szegediense TaxID=73780 RepID=A0ABM9I2A9_9GAMM|nr:protein of unknown function [Methylocaldum szegediense]